MSEYRWEEGKLWLVDYSNGTKFSDGTLAEAFDYLPTQAFVVLAAKRGDVHLVDEAVIIRVDSDEDAEWCEEQMTGYRLRCARKWSPSASGGSLVFDRIARNSDDG